MVLRIAVLLSLMVAFVAAQTEGSGLLDFVPNPEMQYGEEQAMALRRSHFYCLDFNQSRINFPFDDLSVSGGINRAYNWAIFLQYPVLSYLDTLRKNALFDVILRLAQAGDGDRAPLETLTLNDFCVSRVFHNRVSDYQESVLINVYFRGDVLQHPDRPNNPVSIQDFNTFFEAGRAAQDVNSDRSLIRLFREKPALAVDRGIDDILNFTMTEMNAHPFGTDGEGENLTPDNDPTLRAVLIATSIGFVDVRNLSYSNDSFADNPRPINFALEAGDYVFIVLGSLLIAVVLGLVLLGFCIHPFFLS